MFMEFDLLSIDDFDVTSRPQTSPRTTLWTRPHVMSIDRNPVIETNVMSNVNKLVMENEPLLVPIPICIKTRSKLV